MRLRHYTIKNIKEEFNLQTKQSKAQCQINSVLSKHSLPKKATSYQPLVEECLFACLCDISFKKNKNK